MTEGKPSKELFIAILKSKHIWDRYRELIKKFEELKNVIRETKIKNKKIQEEINAHLTLLKISIEKMGESTKKFQDSFEDSIRELKERTISEDTRKHLQNFIEEHLPYISKSTDIDDIIDELLIEAENCLRGKEG